MDAKTLRDLLTPHAPSAAAMLALAGLDPDDACEAVSYMLQFPDEEAPEARDAAGLALAAATWHAAVLEGDGVADATHAEAVAGAVRDAVEGARYAFAPRKPKPAKVHPAAAAGLCPCCGGRCAAGRCPDQGR